MFGQIFRTHLKWSSSGIALMSVVAFVAPTALWRIMSEGRNEGMSAIEVMSGFTILGPTLGFLASCCGVIAVAQAWAVDASTKHVYPLSLPIPWSRYVAMRFSAGAILLVIPTVALLLGCLLVLSMIELPSTLRAYPFTLALRFLLGSLVAYAFAFAVQYLSRRKAAHLLLACSLVVGAVLVGADMTGYPQLTQALARFLFEWPGPLAVFGSEWMLVDV